MLPHLVWGVGWVLGAHNVNGVMLVRPGPGVDIDDVVSVGDLEAEDKTFTFDFLIL